jgi:hypothetical protein
VDLPTPEVSGFELDQFCHATLERLELLSSGDAFTLQLKDPEKPKIVLEAERELQPGTNYALRVEERRDKLKLTATSLKTRKLLTYEIQTIPNMKRATLIEIVNRLKVESILGEDCLVLADSDADS